MPPRTLCARLTLILLLILLPILGGGGLFWFRGANRHLRTEFDKTLLTLAAQASSLISTSLRDLPDGEICASLQQLSGQRGIGVFSLTGKRLCRVGDFRFPGDSLAAIPLKKALSGQVQFLTSPESKGEVRSLVVPLYRQGRITRILVVSGRYSGPQKIPPSILFVFVGLLLTGLLGVLLFYRGVRRQLRPLAELPEQLAKEKTIAIAEEAPQEIADLQQAIVALRNRLSVERDQARQFTADASHELRTPLTILRGETEVALRWAQDPEEIRKALVSNLEEIDRMSRIIEDLLLLSKSEVGEMPLQFEALELVELLDDLCQQMQMLGEEKEISVEFSTSDPKIHIQGDPLRLRQLFLNLLSNALKYTPPKGQVKMRTRLLGSLVEVRVIDSGIGIESQHLAHIFERFYRVDKTRNRSDGGSGLGLSIAQLVAESHGGSIQVQSQPGQGSEFAVFLPCEQQSASPSDSGSKE